MVTDIKQHFSGDLAKKIFGNKANATTYLEVLNRTTPIEGLYNSKGKISSKLDVWCSVVNSWNYSRSLPIIRDLFKQTPKYHRGSEANQAVSLLKAEWEALNLGSFEWPFSQGDFDNFVQRINAQANSGEQKDNSVKHAAVKFRRIKEINTYRNDYIETMIFNLSDDILPTLGHRRGVDFFINGISFDQKVSRSVTNEFKRDNGDEWRAKAIASPLEVAKYLYTYQDEGRFGADPRLLIVFIDEDVSVERIETLVNSCNFSAPQRVSFTYKTKVGRSDTYQTECIVILLYN